MTSQEQFEDYPFPLADGRIAILRLPINLSRGEAERLAAFVATLVVGDGELHSVRADLRERSQP